MTQKRWLLVVNSVLENKITEAVVQGCSVKKVSLKISQNPQEMPAPESLF